MQVRNGLSKAGLLQAADKPGQLFAVPTGHAVHVIPSADAQLQAAFDAAYAGLHGPMGSTTQLSGKLISACPAHSGYNLRSWFASV